MHPSPHAQFLRGLENRLLAALIAICTKHMEWFAVLHAQLRRVGENVGADLLKFVALFLCIPCFQASHFFFKLSYMFGQRRLRLLCGEDFFLKFYDRRVATSGTVNVLQSLRYIEGGLKGAEASDRFTNYDSGWRGPVE